METKRAVVVVLDGVGVGSAPDAEEYGDSGANTLGNLSRRRSLALPNLAGLGLGNLSDIVGVKAVGAACHAGAYGRLRERAGGKDTTAGHWELMGVVSERLPTYPEGFPEPIVKRWCADNQLPGVLGNTVASGTEIIEKLGAEHMRSGKPILYTSADSVWQVAAHERSFGLERLLGICESARIIANELNIGRVIARPFVGTPTEGFTRTKNRTDYSLPPPKPTYLDRLAELGLKTLGLGKIHNIFAGRGIARSQKTSGNSDGLRVLLDAIDERREALVLCNLGDTDTLYGHRRDVEGFAAALEEFDRTLPTLLGKLGESDLFIVTADHGNDPTYEGTDHTREYVPLLVYGGARAGSRPLSDLGILDGFGHVGATVYHFLTSTPPTFAELSGESLLGRLS